MTTFLGIDPGLKGGWAILPDDGSPIRAAPMPLAGKEIDLAALACAWRGIPGLVATLEKVHSMPDQSAQSGFTFGEGYGGVRGVLACLCVPVERVTPQAWKKLILAGMAKGEDAKASTIAWCRSAYPGVPLILPGCRVPHDGLADALALATYGKRNYL